MNKGVDPNLPELFNADAIIKIFENNGPFYGFIGIIFFLFPIALSNIKLFGSKDKIMNKVFFWVGLLIFDIVVAAIITKNRNEIKSMLLGIESEFELWEVIKQGDFWMIFMFGMIPLIITHYVIGNIYNSYRNSKREIVDAEKNKKIHSYDEEILNLNFEKEIIINKKNDIEQNITECKTKITNLDIENNSTRNQLEFKYSELIKQINTIHDEYKARIISGKIFTDVIFENIITSYKYGFIEYLPELYSTNEVSNRVMEINQIK